MDNYIEILAFDSVFTLAVFFSKEEVKPNVIFDLFPVGST